MLGFGKALGQAHAKGYILLMRYFVSFFLFLVSIHSPISAADDFLPARPMPAASLEPAARLTRIAIGSCFTPYGSDAIFGEIARQNPDAFLFMGDNVYARDESDDPELKSLRHAYGALAASQNFATLRADTPLIVAWDDHDYGKNDTGASFIAREYSEQLFDHVWALPSGDERRERPGTYYSTMAGPEGQRVQIIVLDTRFFSSPYEKNPDQSVGRYTRTQDPNQDMLGAAQWQWLGSELNKPADLRILLSSIQVIAEGHYWESWAMMPREQKRLYELLSDTDNLIIVSGDRHSAAIYARSDATPYPLYEMTSSSLNLPLTGWVDDPQDEPGPHRLTKPYYEVNYGMILLDWPNREVRLELRDETSAVIAEQVISLDELRR